MDRTLEKIHARFISSIIWHALYYVIINGEKTNKKIITYKNSPFETSLNINALKNNIFRRSCVSLLRVDSYQYA